MGLTRWFLYDGDCAFCSTCARFIVRHLRTDVRVMPWQFADLDTLGLSAAACDEAVQWVAMDPADPTRPRQAAVGPAAIAALLGRGGPSARVLGRLLATGPMVALAGPVYRFVARHRDRMPGGTATCALPSAQRAGKAANHGDQWPSDSVDGR